MESDQSEHDKVLCHNLHQALILMVETGIPEVQRKVKLYHALGTSLYSALIQHIIPTKRLEAIDELTTQANQVLKKTVDDWKNPGETE